MREHHNKRVGNLGENIASRFLEQKGYTIIERNYRKKWGEIDIICRKGTRWHFIEVKTVSRATPDIQPEENVHHRKLQRLKRAVETYIAENEIGELVQLDVVTVVLDTIRRKALCSHIENVL